MARDDEEGLSTQKKVVAGAAIGVAIPAAVSVAKKLMGDDDDKKQTGPRRGRKTSAAGKTKTAVRKTASRAKKSAAKTTSRAKTKSGTRKTGTRKTAGRKRGSR